MSELGVATKPIKEEKVVAGAKKSKTSLSGGVTLGAMIAVLSALSTGVGFLANYIFATKTEVHAVQLDIRGMVGEMRGDQKVMLEKIDNMDKSIKRIETDIDEIQRQGGR